MTELGAALFVESILFPSSRSSYAWTPLLCLGLLHLASLAYSLFCEVLSLEV